MTEDPAVLKLVPFAAPPKRLNGITVDVRRAEDVLTLIYAFHAEPGVLFIPPPAPFVRQDELWASTCAELFLADPAGRGYTEYNFGASGAFAAWRFADYRQRIADAEPPLDLALSIDHGFLQITARIAVPASGPLCLGLTAVTQTTSDRRDYWALTHPRLQPDFHDARGWKLM